ncbi:MAG TPA: DUF937 domain-containing protein [Sedimentibacter sp.]|nr:DUF937 domain-containing protein [Sedimentibacter sp.]HOH70207.1 DUF937 domain-containing protein [Sedimentibacter sp.]HPW99422.1 DUF937 domain-containing protein [Sedimentibacter sp.]HQB63805.1 DUF937 domain-containing protein [Sedimentibacter sp.]
MDLMEMLSSQLGNENVLKQLSKSTGADSSQIQQAMKLGLPALMQAMGKNASTAEGASSLAKALDFHKDDETDNIEDFLKNVNKEDGSKILNHILGSKNKSIQRNLAKQTGMKADQTTDLMAQLAPLLLGTLGKQKASQKVDSSGLARMLSGALGQGKDNNLMDSVSKLLDADDDGSIVDDITGMLGGFLKKKK